METFEEFKEKFVKWVIDEIEPIQNNGFPVCPYAASARANNKIQFINCSDSISAMGDFDEVNYEVGAAWVGNIDIPTVEKFIAFMTELNPTLEYLLSTRESGHFVQNPCNSVLIQVKKDLYKKRADLHKTSYYDDWTEDYYKEITGNDKSSSS